MCMDLCRNVRRGIDQGPGVFGAAGNGDGGLSTRAGCESPATHAGAVPAVAIPLREPAAGGGSQHSNLQGVGRCSPLARADTGVTSAIGDVHRDFHAETEINRLRSFPLHDVAPSVGLLTAMIYRQAHLPRAGVGRNQVHHESRLMIFMSRGGPQKLMRAWSP